MKPAKNEIVEVYHEVLKRFVRGKWTGKRWMIFNELFGGYDPPPKKMKVKKWRLLSPIGSVYNYPYKEVTKENA